MHAKPAPAALTTHASSGKTSPMRVVTLVFVLALGHSGLARAQPPRYGDAGSNHVGVSLGIGGGTRGFVWGAGAEYGRFLVDGVAPTLEADVSGGSQVLTVARTMAAVRLLPLRWGNVWPLLVPRAGRLFISDHSDLWGAGATAGLLVGLGGRVGLQVAYDYLRLFPSGRCADLANGCSIGRFGLGAVIGF